jgi:hypothetical protein
LAKRRITFMEAQQGNFTKDDAVALLSRLKQFADSLPAGEREALNHIILAPARRSAENVLEMKKFKGSPQGGPGSAGWDWGDLMNFIVEHLFD